MYGTVWYCFKFHLVQVVGEMNIGNVWVDQPDLSQISPLKAQFEVVIGELQPKFELDWAYDGVCKNRVGYGMLPTSPCCTPSSRCTWGLFGGCKYKYSVWITIIRVFACCFLLYKRLCDSTFIAPIQQMLLQMMLRPFCCNSWIISYNICYSKYTIHDMSNIENAPNYNNIFCTSSIYKQTNMKHPP